MWNRQQKELAKEQKLDLDIIGPQPVLTQALLEDMRECEHLFEPAQVQGFKAEVERLKKMDNHELRSHCVILRCTKAFSLKGQGDRYKVRMIYNCPGEIESCINTYFSASEACAKRA